MPEAAGSPDEAAARRPDGWWARAKEALLPTGTFAESSDPEGDLRLGRCLVALFYAAIFTMFLYTLYLVFKTGKVEISSQTFKHDTIETPSVAFCPFNANTSIVLPMDTAGMVTAEIIQPDGHHRLEPSHKMCRFDRSCVCVDMQGFYFEDQAQRDAGHLGFDGTVSERANDFREKVLFETSLIDPSPDNVLKIGLYTASDKRPTWAYAQQGAYTIMSLEIEIFWVTDVSHYSIWEFMKGDLNAFARPRKMFKIYSQQVGGESLGPNITSIVYRMRTYYIEEAWVGESAVSLYTLGFLALWCIARGALTSIFIELVMPAKAADPDRVQVRELPLWLSHGLCLPCRGCAACCFRGGRGKAAERGAPDERSPLLA